MRQGMFAELKEARAQVLSLPPEGLRCPRLLQSEKTGKSGSGTKRDKTGKKAHIYLLTDSQSSRIIEYMIYQTIKADKEGKRPCEKRKKKYTRPKRNR